MALPKIFVQNQYPGLNFDQVGSDEVVLQNVPDIYQRDFSNEGLPIRFFVSKINLNFRALQLDM